MRQFAIDCNSLQNPKNRLKNLREQSHIGSIPIPATIWRLPQKINVQGSKVIKSGRD
jgi:hypothetical protein